MATRFRLCRGSPTAPPKQARRFWKWGPALGHDDPPPPQRRERLAWLTKLKLSWN